VELVDFSASLKNSIVELQWSTASEKDNDYFSVEKSRDGKNFFSIGKVDGAGNSQSLLSYTYQDDDPFDGTSYYRLKQVDFDGTFENSDIKSVHNGLFVDNVGIILFPNPMNILENKVLKLRVDSYSSFSKDMPLQILILNINGAQILDKRITYNNQEIKLIFDRQLLPGIYIVKAITPYKTFTSKFVAK